MHKSLSCELTINQALRRRSVLKGDIKSWAERALESNVNLANSTPSPYKCSACLVSYKESVTELTVIETRIAITNALVKIKWEDKDIPLALAVRMLANLKSEIAFMKTVPVLNSKEVKRIETKSNFDRKSGDFIDVEKEVIDTCMIDRLEMQSFIDAKQKTFDDLNGVVESANHLTKLVTLPG
jgi:hypothetical protein